MNSIKNILKIFDFRLYFDETWRNIGQSPEIKDSQNETVEKSEDQKKIEANKAWMKYLWSYWRNLKAWIDKIAKTEKADDPEFKEFSASEIIDSNWLTSLFSVEESCFFSNFSPFCFSFSVIVILYKLKIFS